MHAHDKGQCCDPMQEGGCMHGGLPCRSQCAKERFNSLCCTLGRGGGGYGVDLCRHFAKHRWSVALCSTSTGGALHCAAHQQVERGTVQHINRWSVALCSTSNRWDAGEVSWP